MKTIYSKGAILLRQYLKSVRKSKGLTLKQAGELLGKSSHTYVQKIETGERRLDVVEYVWRCQAMGADSMIGINIILQDS